MAPPVRHAIVALIMVVAACGGSGGTSPTSVTSPPQMFMTYRSEPGDYVGGGQTRALNAAEASFSGAVGCGNNKVSGWVHSGTSDWLFTFAAPKGSPLVPGAYENAGRQAFRPATLPGLDVDLDGRGCNQLSGRFIVSEAQYAPDETVQRFHVTFEQRCENFSSALTGEIVLTSPSPDATRRQFYMGCP